MVAFATSMRRSATSALRGCFECNQRLGHLLLANAVIGWRRLTHFASRLAIRTDLVSIETLKRDKKLIPRSPSTPFPNDPRTLSRTMTATSLACSERS
jgi:hypothetical protein